MIQFLATHHVRAHWLRKPLHDEVDLRPDGCSHPNPHFLRREEGCYETEYFDIWFVASHRQNINLELVFLLLGVEPLKGIHKRWVALPIKSVGAGMMKAGEQEKVKMKMRRQTEEIGKLDKATWKK